MDLDKLIKDNEKEIQRRLGDDVAKRVAESLSYTLSHEVQKIAEKYIAEHVLPDVQKQLESQRDQLTVSIVAAVKTGLDALSENLVKKMTDNIRRSWKLSNIVKELLD